MDSPSDRIRIVAISGSVRPGNYTGKALALVLDELAREQVLVERLDPAGLALPWPGQAGAADQVAELQGKVREATAVVLATPEYHGSYSSVIKLVIENLGFPSVLSGKPVALLGVAAGRIGAIKALEHLRSVCSHVGALVLPSLVSVANVQSVFDSDGRCLDAGVERQVRSVAIHLMGYVRGYLCPRVTLERMLREPAA
jgi:NAD(P)H-dependent FMN reductase